MPMIDEKYILQPREKQMLLEMLDQQQLQYQCDSNLLKTIQESLCQALEQIKKKLIHYPVEKKTTQSPQEQYIIHKQKQTRAKTRQNKTKIIQNGEILT